MKNRNLFEIRVSIGTQNWKRTARSVSDLSAINVPNLPVPLTPTKCVKEMAAARGQFLLLIAPT